MNDHTSQQPPALDANLDANVGRLCSAWALLEVAVAKNIWEAMCLSEPLGKLITDDLDMKRRWTLLIEVCKLTKLTHLQELLQSKTRALTDLTRDRNLYIHGAITWKPGEKDAHWIIDRGAYAGKRIPAKTETVAATIAAVQALTQEVFPRMETVGPVRTQGEE